jgi:hypothetical protein
MIDAAYDPTKKIQFQVVPQSPHTCAWRLWHALPGATTWTQLGKGTKNTAQTSFGPFPTGTKLLHTLLIGGNANTDWKIEVRTLQDGNPLACAPQIETGFMTSTIARRDTAFKLQ